MITVHRRLSTEWIKLDDDDEAEFLIRPLNAPAMIDVRNELTLEEGVIRISGRGVMTACTKGLADWKGVQDENGEDLPFSPGHIEWLPPEVLSRLGGKIVAASRLSEAERKNS